MGFEAGSRELSESGNGVIKGFIIELLRKFLPLTLSLRFATDLPKF